MISHDTNIRSALRSKQRGFFTMPGGMGFVSRKSASMGLSATIMALGPEMYHKLSESGTLLDSSGNGYTVTEVPTILKAQSPLVSGSTGCIYGSTNGAGFTAPRIWADTYTGGWSCVMFFHKQTPIVDTGGLFWSSGNDNFNMFHQVLPTGALKTAVIIGGSGYDAQSADGVYTWNTVGLYGVTFVPGSGHTIYLNGVAVGSASYPFSGLRISPQGPIIGRTTTFQTDPGFSYSDHAWFTHSLTPTDHAAIWAARNTP